MENIAEDNVKIRIEMAKKRDEFATRQRLAEKWLGDMIQGDWREFLTADEMIDQAIFLADKYVKVHNHKLRSEWAALFGERKYETSSRPT